MFFSWIFFLSRSFSLCVIFADGFSDVFGSPNFFIYVMHCIGHCLCKSKICIHICFLKILFNFIQVNLCRCKKEIDWSLPAICRKPNPWTEMLKVIKVRNFHMQIICLAVETCTPLILQKYSPHTQHLSLFVMLMQFFSCEYATEMSEYWITGVPSGYYYADWQECCCQDVLGVKQECAWCEDSFARRRWDQWLLLPILFLFWKAKPINNVGCAWFTTK